MKTSVEITDSLFVAARRVARDEGTTMRALIEEGLRRIVGECSERGGFEGASPYLKAGSWDEIRRRIYEHRGE